MRQMNRWLVLGLALLATACGERTEVQVHVDGAPAVPPLVAPTEIDALDVRVVVDGSPVWSQSYPTTRQGTVDETIAFKPGRQVAGAFTVEVVGRKSAQQVAAGSVATGFRSGALVQVDIKLARSGSPPVDAGHVDAAVADRSGVDQTGVDAGVHDVAGSDHGPTDSVPADQRRPDAIVSDSAVSDSAVNDSAVGIDHPAADIATADLQQPDTAVSDSASAERTPCQIDPDWDNDGHDRIACGGDDCNDGRSDVYPGAVELCDDVDQDCDGLNWDVPGTLERTIDVAECVPFLSTMATGGISLAVSSSQLLGATWVCDASPLTAYWAAVAQLDGTVPFVGQLAANSASISPRIAAVAGDSFISVLDTGSEASFTVLHSSGLAGTTSLPNVYNLVDVETAPWAEHQIVALYEYLATPFPLSARVVSDDPAFLGSELALGTESWCCGQIPHELLRTTDGLLAISCGNNNKPLQARWITGPTLTAPSAAATWRSSCDVWPYEIRAAVAHTTDGRRALTAVIGDTVEFHLADIASTADAPMLESLTDLPYVDAAPIETGNSGLAIVALKPNGEVVWLGAASSIYELRQDAQPLATGVYYLDAIATGGGRVAIGMVSSDNRFRIQIRSGTCAN